VLSARSSRTFVAKWLVWHGKGSKAVERIKALNGRLLTREGYEFSTLWWNLNTVSCYLRNNAHTLANYGDRYRKGLSISSSIAESAVNQVVSHRMAKKRQMRRTDERAHCMALVRVARGTLVAPHLRAQDSHLASARIHRGSVAKPTPTNEQNRTEQNVKPCRTPRQPDKIDLPNFCTLSFKLRKFRGDNY
jgi:hypothetical protein